MEKNMEKKHVVDKRSIKLEDVLKADYIPFLWGVGTGDGNRKGRLNES